MENISELEYSVLSNGIKVYKREAVIEFLKKKAVELKAQDEKLVKERDAKLVEAKKKREEFIEKAKPHMQAYRDHCWNALDKKDQKKIKRVGMSAADFVSFNQDDNAFDYGLEKFAPINFSKFCEDLGVQYVPHQITCEIQYAWKFRGSREYVAPANIADIVREELELMVGDHVSSSQIGDGIDTILKAGKPNLGVGELTYDVYTGKQVK